jgi:hypothetical protein
VYGIRAENFSVLTIKSGIKLKAKVVHSYFVGSATIIEVMIEGKQIEIRVPANFKVDGLTEIYLNPSLIMELAL